MTRQQPPAREVVPSAIGSTRGPGVVLAAVALVAIVTLGVLGRLVPDVGPPRADVDPDASAPPASRTAKVAPGFRLVSPIEGTVWLRATEIDVQGVAPPGVRALEATVRVAGAPLGRATADVDPAGAFDAAVGIIPPWPRTAATLEVREAGGASRTLAEVSFSIEAGSLVLIRDGSALEGRAGARMVVDVLVYGRPWEVRGLLTSQGGTLVSSASQRLFGAAPARGGPPRLVALELDLPEDAPSGRARLHVLGIGPDGSEMEHVDATVWVSSAG